MKQLLKSALLLFIAISFTNCDNQNDGLTTPLNDIQQIQKEFTLNNFNDSYIKENLIVNWNDFNTIPKDSITSIYEYNTSFKVKRTLESNDHLFDVTYKILAIKDDSENWSFELIKFLANNDSPLNNPSYFYPNAFSGTLYHYNLEGKTIKIKAYNDGELVHEFIPDNVNTNNTQSKYYPKKQSNVEPIDPNETGGYYILVSTIHYTDWYANNQGGSTLYYTHSVYNSTTHEYVYVPSSTSNYTTSLHSHTSPQFGSSGGTNNHGNEIAFANEEELNNLLNQVAFLSPDYPIENMVKFLLCIDIDSPATLTIYADQPIVGSKFPVKGTDPGHAFASLTQNGNTVVFGFYPKTKAKAALLDEGAIGNNQTHEYDTSITTEITPEQVLSIIEYAVVKPTVYNVNHFNCTDYAIEIGNLGGLSLPNCYTPLYPGGGGSAPSVLGEHIRNLPESNNYITNTSTNNAPQQSGDCN